MPWKKTTPMDERMEFMLLHESEKLGTPQLAVGLLESMVPSGDPA